MFDNVVKEFNFEGDAETAFDSYIGSLHDSILSLPEVNGDYPELSQKIFGLDFKNPVGLGAGFDKRGRLMEAMHRVGFGFVEIGTVVPKPQEGNLKPRMFTYVEEESMMNAMGFNSIGSEMVIQNMKGYPFKFPVAVNLGKNKATPNENAIDDYKYGIEKFKDMCDFFVINVSSPNTPNLRDLQNEEFIKSIFSAGKNITQKPILLKISPDMSNEQAINICRTAVESGASGIVATNTTVDYSLLKNAKNFGGLSGRVLKEKSYNMFRAIAKELFGKTKLISVGGIFSGQDAYDRIKAGASLVEVWTSVIFKGPMVTKQINMELLELMKKDGYKSLEEAVGSQIK